MPFKCFKINIIKDWMGFKDKDEMMYRNNMIPGKVHLCNSSEKKYENKRLKVHCPSILKISHWPWWYYWGWRRGRRIWRCEEVFQHCRLYIKRKGLQKGRSLTLTKTNLLENRRFIKRLYNFIHYTKKTRCPVLHYIFYWGEFIFIFIWRRNLKSWTPNWQF